MALWRGASALDLEGRGDGSLRRCGPPSHSHRRTQWRRRTGHLCPGNREVRQRGRGIAVSPGEYDHEGVTALHGESFSGPFRESERNIAEGHPDVLLRPGVPWGSTWSARAYVDCFNRDNRYSVTTHAANTGCPTLYVFGAEESAVGGPQEIPVVGAKHVWMGLGTSAASNPSTHLPDTSTPLGCRAHVCLVGPVSPSEQGL